MSYFKELDMELREIYGDEAIDGPELDEDSDLDLDGEYESDDDFDGQPTEYEEWQDLYGGDDNFYDSCVIDY